MSSTIEYVHEADTIADIALKETASSSLRTTTSILLAVLLIVSFIANAALFTSICSCQKLRSTSLYGLFAHFGFICIVDCALVMFLSLLYVASGVWYIGDVMCRINAMLLHMYTLMSIMVMAGERALGLTVRPTHGGWPILVGSLDDSLCSAGRLIFVHCLLFATAMAFAIPVLTPAIPVSTYKYRYLCAIDRGSPVAYSVVQLFVFAGCLFFCMGSFGTLLSRRHLARSLPVQHQEYGEFIRKTRAVSDHISRGKLVILIFATFVILVGPYIILCFLVQIYNSNEISRMIMFLEMHADADTLITWLKFLFTLLAPIEIFCWCPDIWENVLAVVFCRRTNALSLGYTSRNGNMMNSNVMTLVATADGLQLKMPPNHAPAPSTGSSVINPTPYYEHHNLHPPSTLEDITEVESPRMEQLAVPSTASTTTAERSPRRSTPPRTQRTTQIPRPKAKSKPKRRTNAPPPTWRY